MGFWGPGLYENDCAEDIRDAFQSLMNSGLTPRDAKVRILDDFQSVFLDVEEGPLAKLVLADLMWQNGSLEQADLEAALAYIDSGADIDFWKQASPSLWNTRAEILSDLAKQFCSPMPKISQKKKSHKANEFNWKPNQVYALLLSSQEAERLNLRGEYMLIYIYGEDAPIRGYRVPKVWIKFTEGGSLPKNSEEFNRLAFVQIACTHMEKRFGPFASFEELPPEFRQQYHPDQWGYLPEYSMYILESRGNHPPKDIIFLGEYQNVLPPVNNYMRYDSALGAAWKYLEESILLSYRLHNLRQAKFYCPCDSYSE